MARREHDREDLLADATALVERVSLRTASGEDVVAGFRSDSSLSVYFGADRVYHFNPQGELRRAFVGNLLFKAERGHLVSLRRERHERAVDLMRHELDPGETEAFLAEMGRCLHAFRAALDDGSCELIGKVPESADVVGRVRDWLSTRAGSFRIARGPRVG